MVLNQVIQQAFIICYQEDVSALENALRKEGISKIIRVSREYTEDQLLYSRASRCLLGHHDAWMQVKDCEGFSLVVEADFVPCVGFGEQTLPIPHDKIGSAWAWLYSCANRIYEYDSGYIRGHSSTTVAYVLDAQAASKVEGFLEHQFSNHGPENYFAWDTWMRMYAQANDVYMYLVPRSLGEHGGITNQEHLTRIKYPNHQADILINKLHFLPLYAKGSSIRYWKFRITAYLRAWARLICLRYVELGTFKNPNFSFRYKLRLLKLGVFRLLPFIPLSQLTKKLPSRHRDTQ